MSNFLKTLMLFLPLSLTLGGCKTKSPEVDSSQALVTEASSNQPPKVNAGVDRSFNLPTNSTVFTGLAADGDGDTLTFTWKQIAGVEANIASSTSLTTNITGLTQGSYTFRFTASDGKGGDSSDDVNILVGVDPVVNAGADKTITLPTNSLSLTATATDGDADVMNYTWTKLTGGAASISSPNSLTTNITGLSQGSYTFRFSASDKKGVASTDDVQVVVSAAAVNSAPVVNAGADKSITLPTNSIVVTATATDANADAMTYSWVKVSGPVATIVASTSLTTNITGLSQGTYTFRFSANDGKGGVSSDNVNILVGAAPVVNSAPVVNAGVDKSITLPANSVVLTATASDANADAMTYSWIKVSGPAATIASSSALSTNVTGLVKGSYVFRFTANDGKGGVKSDEVSVTVSDLTDFANSEILKVGAGEYCTAFINDQGRVITALDENGWKLRDVGLSHAVEIHGGQYNVIVRNSATEIWSLSPRVTPYQPQLLKRVNIDAAGSPFLGSTRAYAWYQAGLSLKDGKIFTWGQDILKINGGADIEYPRQLQQPAGKTIVHLSMAAYSGYILAALASDGTVWTYGVNAPTPVKINLPAPAIKLSNINAAGFVVETATDLLAWGVHGGYFGIPNFTTVPTSIKARFTAAGAVFPTKEIVGNAQTLHIIDQKDEMYGMGSNMQGNIGNGKQYPTWRTHNNPFAWSWSNNEMLEGVSKIPGKFKNLTSSDTITFYFYAQDLGGNWYSWGRNKSTSLGNGISLNGTDSSKYPDALNVPAPTLVTPLKTTWKFWKNATQWGPSTFNPNEPLPPMTNAGINQYLTGVSSTILYGSGSHQQEGTIDEYTWTKLSGPSANIVAPSSQNTSVTGLSAGTYVFQLKVINHLRVEGLSTVKVVVQ